MVALARRFGPDCHTQRADQFRTGHPKFGDAVTNQAIEKFFAQRRYAQQDTTAIALSLLPPEETAFFHAVDQLDDTVVPKLQALGQSSNRRLLPRGQAAQLQQ